MTSSALQPCTFLTTAEAAVFALVAENPHMRPDRYRSLRAQLTHEWLRKLLDAYYDDGNGAISERHEKRFSRELHGIRTWQSANEGRRHLPQ